MVEKGKLYYETLCEHGYIRSHYTCDHIGYPEYNQMEHTDEKCHCPGGSRTEVTQADRLIDAVDAMYDGDLRALDINDFISVGADWDELLDAAIEVRAALVEGGNQ